MIEHPRTVEQNAVLALAFNELLEAPQPVGVELLARAAGDRVQRAEVEAADWRDCCDDCDCC